MHLSPLFYLPAIYQWVHFGKFQNSSTSSCFVELYFFFGHTSEEIETHHLISQKMFCKDLKIKVHQF